MKKTCNYPSIHMFTFFSIFQILSSAVLNFHAFTQLGESDEFETIKHGTDAKNLQLKALKFMQEKDEIMLEIMEHKKNIHIAATSLFSAMALVALGEQVVCNYPQIKRDIKQWKKEKEIQLEGAKLRKEGREPLQVIGPLANIFLDKIFFGIAFAEDPYTENQKKQINANEIVVIVWGILISTITIIFIFPSRNYFVLQKQETVENGWMTALGRALSGALMASLNGVNIYFLEKKIDVVRNRVDLLNGYINEFKAVSKNKNSDLNIASDLSKKMKHYLEEKRIHDHFDFLSIPSVKAESNNGKQKYLLPSVARGNLLPKYCITERMQIDPKCTCNATKTCLSVTDKKIIHSSEVMKKNTHVREITNLVDNIFRGRISISDLNPVDLLKNKMAIDESIDQSLKNLRKTKSGEDLKKLEKINTTTISNKDIDSIRLAVSDLKKNKKVLHEEMRKNGVFIQDHSLPEHIKTILKNGQKGESPLQNKLLGTIMGTYEENTGDSQKDTKTSLDSSEKKSSDIEKTPAGERMKKSSYKLDSVNKEKEESIFSLISRKYLKKWFSSSSESESDSK